MLSPALTNSLSALGAAHTPEPGPPLVGMDGKPVATPASPIANALSRLGSTAPPVAAAPAPPMNVPAEGGPPPSSASASHHLAHRIHGRLHEMPAALLSHRTRANLYMQQVVPELLRNPSLQYADLVAALVKAVEAGAMGQQEALHFASKLPSDPAKLRAALEHLHGFVHHSRVLLLGEHARRSVAGQASGASV